MRKESKKINMPVVIEKDKDGFFAFCPSLQGCYSQGDSYDEVMKNIQEAVELFIEDEKKIIFPSNISLTSIEVKV